MRWIHADQPERSGRRQSGIARTGCVAQAVMKGRRITLPTTPDETTMTMAQTTAGGIVPSYRRRRRVRGTRIRGRVFWWNAKYQAHFANCKPVATAGEIQPA